MSWRHAPKWHGCRKGWLWEGLTKDWIPDRVDIRELINDKIFIKWYQAELEPRYFMITNYFDKKMIFLGKCLKPLAAFCEPKQHKHSRNPSKQAAMQSTWRSSWMLCSSWPTSQASRLVAFSSWWLCKIKGQLGVPLTVYPWSLLCSLGFLGIITHKYPLSRAYIGISHRGTLVGCTSNYPLKGPSPSSRHVIIMILFRRYIGIS